MIQEPKFSRQSIVDLHWLAQHLPMVINLDVTASATINGTDGEPLSIIVGARDTHYMVGRGLDKYPVTARVMVKKFSAAIRYHFKEMFIGAKIRPVRTNPKKIQWIAEGESIGGRTFRTSTFENEMYCAICLLYTSPSPRD